MTVNFARAHFSPEAEAPPAQVIFKSVGKVYRHRGATAVPALETIDFEIRRGEIFGIIGRSGAGKSSLVRLINGLERPSTGTLTVDGLDVATLGAKDLIALRRRIGMIFQGFNLLSSRTTMDNVALPLVLAGQSRKAARAAALAALDLVGLGDKAEAYPARLSGGQRQRAGIARAIVGKPDLLLSDEATSALDPETTRSILALLRDINRRLGITIVLITHEMDVIRQVADRVGVLDKGRLVEIGGVAQVFGNPSEAATRALLRRDDEGATNDRPSIDEEAIVSVDIGDRDDVEIDLFAIATALGPGARLRRGGIDGVGEEDAGRLYLALGRRPPGEAEEALARLRAIHPGAEIVRHAR